MRISRRNRRIQAVLTFSIIGLVVALALGPDGFAWRLPAGALASVLALEAWRRGRSRDPTSAGPIAPALPAPQAKSLLSTGLYDPLTRLPNRTLLNELLEKQVAQAVRSGHRLGVMVCDVDRFKSFNDSLGQTAGDRLLRHLASRFQSQIRQSDTLGRTGGDGFSLIVAKVERPEEVVRASQRVLATLNEPFVMGQNEVVVSASAGVSVFPDDATDPALLLSHAEEALARAKAQGGSNLQLFAPSMNRRTKERAILEQELRRTITDKGLTIHYQPQIALADGRLTGMEALVRWHHPEHGLMSAGRFIPLAEETGLMNQLGAWLMEEVCRQNAEWLERGLPSVPVSLNVSIRQFQGGDVAGLVQRSLERSGLDPELLQLEITETIAMLETDRIAPILARVRELGVKIHLDDFGTGYSSLSYLLRYPVNVVKIDRSFVEGVPRSEESAKIVRLTISLARSLGIGLIAEGIETREQLEFLRKEGCPTGQGFLLGRPLPVDKFERLMESGSVDLESIEETAAAS